MAVIPKWIRDILTDDTGINFTPDKVAMVSGVVVFHGLAITHVVINKQPFDPVAFGGGFGALLAGGGGAMWLASRQKPSGGGQ
jgi:hypothetical protein